MKNIIVGVIFVSLTAISCDTHTGFSSEFKDNFTRECIKNAQVNMGQSKAEKYCNCMLGVVMTKYRSDTEADKKMLNMSMNDMMKLAQPCL